MNDLENYKYKSEASKAYATYFSPFYSVNEFNEEELKNMI